MTLDDHGRPDPPMEGSEEATLLGFLDYQRATFAWRCRGLTDEQLRATLHPTSMTLAGMLKHLAVVEDYWFVEVVAEQPSPWAHVDWRADEDWDWHTALEEPGDDLRALWEQRVEAARQICATEVPKGLGATHPAWGGRGTVSVRWVLTHMIEEYARHNGHADLLREAIDGVTGE
jgi:uncharacterized damage-inducible protein DinB